MPAEVLLRHLTNAVFVAIFIGSVTTALRTRRRAAVDAAGFFTSAGLIVIIGLLADATGTGEALVVSILQLALVVLMPYFLVRIADDFDAVPAGILRAATVGVVIALASVIALPVLDSRLYILVLFGYICGSAGYASWRFVRIAAARRGVTQRRMQAAALGSAFLSVTLLAAVFPFLWPGTEGFWLPLSSICGFASAVAYYIGFSAPKLLRRIWQGLALREFLHLTNSTAAFGPLAGHLDRIEAAVAAAVGTQRAVVMLWDEDDARMSIPGADGSSIPLPRAETPIVIDVYRTQSARLVEDAARENPDNADFYRAFGFNVLLVAPITLGERRFGVVSAFSERSVVFADDDLDLLVSLSAAIAGFLQRHFLANELIEARTRDESIRLREDFVAAAAHDLRGPLTTLMGRAQLQLRRAKREGLPELEVEAELFVRETSRMRRLSDGVLDAARADRVGFVRVREPLDLRAVAVDAVAAAVLSAQHRLILDDGPPVQTLGDALRLQEVVQNLIENATKYSPDGGDIHIRVDMRDTYAHLEVADQGIGIAPEDLETVFELYHRGSNDSAPQVRGAGLGLFICKRIVEEHGGRIWMESTLGAWSRVHVELPTRPD